MPKRPLHTPVSGIAMTSHYCERLDQTLPLLRTLLLIAGVLAAALKAGSAADYLFVSGLLLHWAIGFQRWWRRS